MKPLFILLPVLFLFQGAGHLTVPVKSRVASKVYRWEALKMKKSASGHESGVLKGSTTHLENLEVTTHELLKGKSQPSEMSSDKERLLIIKEGKLEVTIEGKAEILGPGSVSLVLPGDTYLLKNVGEGPASFYKMVYRSKNALNPERGVAAGGSFSVDWEKVEFREHKKGGRRNFFDRPTAMCDDFEMHVTNLNPNTASHDPHTHVVEEIILLVRGDVEMHIDGKTGKATAGDLVFLDSMVPHATTNIGKEQCIYFAFQWK